LTEAALVYFSQASTAAPRDLPGLREWLYVFHLRLIGMGEPYNLPSRLTASGWINSTKETRLAVTSVKRMPYNAPPRSGQYDDITGRRLEL
jgi:hypothetical protein